VARRLPQRSAEAPAGSEAASPTTPSPTTTTRPAMPACAWRRAASGRSSRGHSSLRARGSPSGGEPVVVPSTTTQSDPTAGSRVRSGQQDLSRAEGPPAAEVGLFDSLIERIGRAYDELEHRLGWRFLYMPSRTLDAPSGLLFVGTKSGRLAIRVSAAERRNGQRVPGRAALGPRRSAPESGPSAVRGACPAA
jgi:hypothetical protein